PMRPSSGDVLRVIVSSPAYHSFPTRHSTDREAPDLLPLAVEEWLTWLATEKGRVPSTLAAYRRDVRRWWRWLRARGLDLGDVREPDVEAYIADLRDAGLAPATVARAVVAVRSLHRFL